MPTDVITITILTNIIATPTTSTNATTTTTATISITINKSTNTSSLPHLLTMLLLQLLLLYATSDPYTLLTRNVVMTNGLIHDELLTKLQEARMWIE